MAATAAPIDVSVNGEMRVVPAGTSVADLLRDLELQRDRVAVERNREVVPRAAHAACHLTAGDAIEIVTFVGGG